MREGILGFLPNINASANHGPLCFFLLTLSVLVIFCPYFCVLISRAGMLKEPACAFVRGYLNYVIEAFTDICDHWKRVNSCGNCIIFYSFAGLIGCIDFILLYATELVSFFSCCM